MSRRKTNTYNNVQYQKLSDSDPGYLDSQFQQPYTEKIPWKAIGLASLLCLGGLFMLTLGSLIVTGHLDTKNTPALNTVVSKLQCPLLSLSLCYIICLSVLTITECVRALSKFNDRMWPLIIIGIIMFVPGVYHIRIALYAYKQYPGYSFDDIPEFD